MKKQKLTLSERTILRVVIYPETFANIETETGYTFGTIRDDLMKLINHGYVEVFDQDLVTSVSPFYDSDNIDKFCFKATKNGLTSIQRHAV